MCVRLLIAGCVLGVVTLVASAQEVYRTITPEKLDKVLKDIGVKDVKKEPDPNNKTHVAYHLDRKAYKVTLHYFGGQDLMLAADFSDAMPLEVINAWNQATTFSRAVLYKDNTGALHSTLEANLDVAGGISDESIKHFLGRYDEEVKKFDRFLATTWAAEEDVYKNIDNDRLELIFKLLKIDAKKTAGKDKGHVYFDFEKDKLKLRLHSFGGKELMIEARFKKTALDKLNFYNLNCNFIRAVLHRSGDGPEYTTLEANLDCQGGVSDNIIGSFIRAFYPECRQFEAFLKQAGDVKSKK